SAHEWRAVREGEAHTAPKTSANNTPESFIVGVGASGALLAGAAIVFVMLVGLVSFNVWPVAREGSTDSNVELSAATPNAPSQNSNVAPVSAAAGQLASANAPGSSGGSGGNAGNGGNGASNGGGNGPGGQGGSPKRGTTPQPTTPTQTTGDENGNGNGNGNS